MAGRTHIKWTDPDSKQRLILASVESGATQPTLDRILQEMQDDIRSRYGEEVAKTVKFED